MEMCRHLWGDQVRVLEQKASCNSRRGGRSPQPKWTGNCLQSTETSWGSGAAFQGSGSLRPGKQALQSQGSEEAGPAEGRESTRRSGREVRLWEHQLARSRPSHACQVAEGMSEWLGDRTLCIA